MTVGRLPQSDVVIDDPSVSRRHALIVSVAVGHTVQDVGSTNGTWVRGIRVGEQPVLLQPGDQIALGDQGVVLGYQIEEAAPGPRTEPVALDPSSHPPSPGVAVELPARRFAWGRMGLATVVMAVLVGAAALILLRIGDGDVGPTLPAPPVGPITVPTTRAVTISTEDGATLFIPEGTFDREIALLLDHPEDSGLPSATGTMTLIADIYEVELQGFADQRKPITLSIPYHQELLPEGTTPDQLTIVRWDGESWEELPSTVDMEATLVSAQMGQFSFVSAAVSWSRSIYYRGFLDNTYTMTDAAGNPLFIIDYDTEAGLDQGVFVDDTVPLADDDRDGAPDYVQKLGRYLLKAREHHEAYFGATEPAVAYPIRIFVVNLGWQAAPGGPGTAPTGVEGATAYPGYFIRIHHDLVDDRLDDPLGWLKRVAAHELLHVWHYAQLDHATKQKHNWWLEATARWVEAQVFGELDLYIQDIGNKAPNPPLKGFGSVNDRSKERYATSSPGHLSGKPLPGLHQEYLRF